MNIIHFLTSGLFNFCYNKDKQKYYLVIMKKGQTLMKKDQTLIVLSHFGTFIRFIFF
ncbi:MAG: hypothetical protein ACI86M_003212 [Saprospiraceae bacterium]|jgi:hypothetical protein